MEKSAMSQGVVQVLSRRPTRTRAPEGSERTTRETICASPDGVLAREDALRQAPRPARRGISRETVANVFMGASLPRPGRLVWKSPPLAPSYYATTMIASAIGSAGRLLEPDFHPQVHVETPEGAGVERPVGSFRRRSHDPQPGAHDDPDRPQPVAAVRPERAGD